MPDGPLSGRRALVTGGTRGIGRAIAERLRDHGASVTVTGTSVENRDLPVNITCVAVDFTNNKDTAKFAEELRIDPPDILVNNAGINKIAPFAEIDPADFDRIQLVNVRAPFLLSRAVAPGMVERGWGRILNIGSIWSVVSIAQRASYSTSKFGVDGMTAAMSAELAADGVLVNTVSPGFVDTDMTRRVLGDDGIAELTARVPAKRLAQPEEIAALVAWLAGPENTYVTGQNVVIDGGFTRT